MFAGAIQQRCSVVHQSAGRGQHLAGWTDVDIGFLPTSMTLGRMRKTLQGLKRCKLVQIVDADRMFQAREAINYLSETVVTEPPMFLFLEFFRHGIVFVR